MAEAEDFTDWLIRSHVSFRTEVSKGRRGGRFRVVVMYAGEIASPAGQVHCMPMADLRSHYPLATCWCKPEEVEDGVWEHQAADGREQYETGEREFH